MPISRTNPIRQPRRWGVRRLATTGMLVLIGLMLVIQLVPYGRDHSNPPVIAEPGWASPETRILFTRACADCHSNQTVWPWYSNIAPVSWLITRDVLEGREEFNISEWGREENQGDEAAESIREGSMPPPQYLPLHPEAVLSVAEKQQLITGLVAMFGDDDRGRDGERDRDDDQEQREDR